MSNTTRNILIGSGIVCLIGFLLCVIGGVMGAKDDVLRRINDFTAERGIHVMPSEDVVHVDWSEYGESVLAGDIDKKNITEGSKISELVLELGKGEVSIKQSEDDDVYVSGSGVKIGYAFHDDALKIASVGKKSGGKMTIYLPEYEMDALELEVGAGEFEVGADLNVKEINVKLGAGEAELGNLKAENVCLEVGAGDINIKDVETQELEVAVAAGNATVRGSVLEKAKVSVAAGEADLMLSGSEDDYRVEASAGMGNVRVGKQSVSGIGASQQFGNGDIKLDLSCAMGDLNVSFED